MDARNRRLTRSRPVLLTTVLTAGFMPWLAVEGRVGFEDQWLSVRSHARIGETVGDAAELGAPGTRTPPSQATGKTS